MIASQNKYMVVGNRRIPPFKSLSTLPDRKQDFISIQLPDWCRNFNGTRIIKVYGTQVFFIKANYTSTDYEFDGSMPLEATLHSNIAENSNAGVLVDPSPDLPPGPTVKPGEWQAEGPFTGDINQIYDQYVLTTNNFYTPKTYEYTDKSILEARFWFKNRYGMTIPIYYVYHDTTSEGWFYTNFLIFKIEMELLTI
jgi:hypothetical protein